MNIEQFSYGPKGNTGLTYEQTAAVSTLLPESKIIELYNIGERTRKPIKDIQLHQNLMGEPVISVTYAGPTHDKQGRATTYNHTFLISLKPLTQELSTLLQRRVQELNGSLEPIKLVFKIS